VTPLAGVVTRNTTFVPAHTVAADTRVISGVAGTGDTYAVTVAALADWQVTPPAVTLEYTDTDLVPVEAPLTV
jgi:hypothetical protein